VLKFITYYILFPILDCNRVFLSYDVNHVISPMSFTHTRVYKMFSWVVIMCTMCIGHYTQKKLLIAFKT